MTELHHMLQTLKQPEYLHILLNPLPVYATAMGVLALILGLLIRNRGAQVVALIVVIIGCGSVWPVSYYGHHGYDRVYSMSYKDAQQWLDVHQDRAEDAQWMFYATAVVALVAIVTSGKFPRFGSITTKLTLLAAIVCFALGVWISHAGGQVRHGEFRSGPHRTPSRTNRTSRKTLGEVEGEELPA